MKATVIVSLVLAALAFALVCCVIMVLFAWRKNIKTVRLMNMGGVVSDTAVSSPDEKVITLTDNEGGMKLSVRLKNIYYIESDDNYIKVWYQDYTGSIKQYMLRCRLKTVEESFEGSDLVRCHRKYIINMVKVQVLHKEKDGYYADLGIDSIGDVPVSKTYEALVLGRFNER
ncbi:MAG: LytTR family transcriptional regulator [Bacteroidales bacterium]|nr:LytTR family transcriptional regulator [Bacteroidales bacterium]